MNELTVANVIEMLDEDEERDAKTIGRMLRNSEFPDVKKKDVNRILYTLEKEGVVVKRIPDGEMAPKWRIKNIN